MTPDEPHYRDETRTDQVDALDLANQYVYVLWEGGSVRRPLDTGTTLVLGRGNECDIQVVHPSLSRKHVAIVGGTPPYVEDLGSTNGVRVGSRRLESGKREALLPGDAAMAGPVVIMVQGRDDPATTEAAPPAMSEVRRVLDLVAKSAISVLLLGETGVGKEVAASQVHTASLRAGRPMVQLNCAAFTESLLEAELFGYERGAFTGAAKAKPGLFESAEGGTVFLDEVGDMPLATQVKVLRVIENREVRRIGGLDVRAIDVRFISATNRDLRAQVAKGVFRQDLFYRLNGITVRIPPLRQRRDEIPALASEFVAYECGRSNRPTLAVDPVALRFLQQQPWSGNIRELRNVVERAVALCTTTLLTREHLVFDEEPIGAPVSSNLDADVSEYEKALVTQALDAAGGNQTKAARALGITRRALINRIKTHDLPRPRKK